MVVGAVITDRPAIEVDGTTTRIVDLKPFPAIVANSPRVLHDLGDDQRRHRWRTDRNLLRSDLDGAEELLIRTLELNIELMGEKHSSVATAQNNLGGVYHEKGNFKEAERLYRQALAIKIDTFHGKHPDIAATLNNLGRALQARGELEEAEAFLRQSRAIRVALFGENHKDVAHLTGHLGWLMMEAGDYTRAGSLFRQEYKVKIALYDENHPVLASAFFHLAQFATVQGEYPRAASLFDKSLAINEKMHRRKATDIYTSPGELYLLSGELTRAEELLNTALSAIRERLGAGHPKLVAVTCLLAEVAWLQGDFEQASQWLNHAEPIARNSQNPHHPYDFYHQRARFRFHQGIANGGNLEGVPDARLREVLNYRREVLGERHPKVADTLIDLAEQLAWRGRDDEALSLIEEAIGIYLELLPADHERHQVASSIKGLILQGRGGEGLVLLREARDTMISRLGEAHWQVRHVERRLERAVAVKND